MALAAQLIAVVPAPPAEEIPVQEDSVQEDSVQQGSVQQGSVEPASVQEDRTEKEGANPLVLAGTTLTILGALTAWAYGAWWDTGDPLVSFHFKETGFLNQDTYAGGSDKLGHTYVCYLVVRAGTALYEALGLSHLVAAIVSSSAVFVVSNGVEVMDGFTEYGFEYGDVIANTLGIGLGILQDLSPQAERLVGMRLGYTPSRDFLVKDRTFIKWINDYSGMLFYFDVKGKGVAELFDRDPGLWRYVIGGVVWGTDKYSPVRIHEERRRSFGVHVGLSLPEVLRSAYEGDAGVEKLATFFDYYALPFISVTAMTDLNTGEWYLNFGVSNRLEIGL